MDRIENVDLREALTQIAENNTFYHLHNDLGISFEQMERAAKMDDPSEKTLIWVSYPSGINCYSEREVFQLGTRAHNGVVYHGEGGQNERRLAYAVTVSGVVDGKLRGSISEIDISRYAENVKKNVLTSDTMRLFLNDLRDNTPQFTMSRSEYDSFYPSNLPQYAYARHEPNDPARLYAVLDEAAKEREAACTPRDVWGHTSRLYDERYAYYAAQTIRDLDKLHEANGPDKKTFTVRANAYVANAFGQEELGKLLDALPYSSAALIVRKGQPDMRLVVPRDEVLRQRQQATSRQKPSILASLQAAKEAAAAQNKGREASMPKRTTDREV